MWWEAFETEPILTFEKYKRNEWIQVHYYDMKLSIMIHKLSTDFLSYGKSSIAIVLARVPMVHTYKYNFSGFINVVNHKLIPQMSIPDQSLRNINKATHQVRGMTVYVARVIEEVVDNR